MEEATMGEAATPAKDRLEEGELSETDALDLEYTPLPRPADYKPYLNPVALMRMNIQDDQTDESEHEPSSSADSDSDRPVAKKRRVRTRRHLRQEQPERNNKYNIWCKTVQEDTLADDLLVCDVTTNNYLGIESYHHRLRYVNDDAAPSGAPGENDSAGVSVGFHFSNKRSFRERNRRDARPRLRRPPSYDSDNEKGEVRCIPDLAVDCESPDADVARDIAAKLQEEKDNLILRIVEHAGKQKAIEIFKETKRIEADGGMIVMNGTRRRTPGGVFIFLLKRDKDVTQDIVNKIFADDRLENKTRNKDRCKYRNRKVEELKQSLTDGALPALRTRAEQWVAARAAEDLSRQISNPPPSPATDGRDGSSDVDTAQYSPRYNARVSAESIAAAKHPPLDPRASQHNAYDEDYLEIGRGDDMDLF